ncbi:MAG: 3-(methylthio)propionyl-CoA ligase [Thiomonas sp.]|uniref:3-(methylthio)propionyl-CoA ligase n=1 Tax=Thiomonas sp. TaxID=2047785 RepID=UPI002A3682F4|nr:3-(methylthio)propionyl-CoA ligase [Thiomonas sp.]MDY0331576.1 3-(methylthio)propionyl-CoA ligase [Thiomonas sp.]
MLGLMQNHPLLISGLLDFAARYHGDTEIVSRRVEGDIHRTTYAQARARAKQCANALDALGVARQDRVGTLAWNGYRHFELYYAVSGSERILHTVNPRLHPDQIAWIVNHADDRALCFDLTFAPIVKAIAPRCPGVRHWVALCEADALPADLAEVIPGLLSYDALLAAQPARYAWPVFDENTASSLCYTSGTTGHPKGVLYSHRSTVLHAYAAALPDVMSLSARDSVLPVVPMFHVNAWGIPYAAALTGAKLVFPGPALDGQSLFELMRDEGVTLAAGVPTVWLGLLNYMRASGLSLPSFKRTVIGGAAAAPAMIRAFEEEFDVRVLHAWGMTETSPLGTLCSLKNKHLTLDKASQLAILGKQGRPIFGVDLRVVDGNGSDLPWDGKSAGNLLVRGPWIASDYYRSDAPSPLQDGWFPTGDVATIDADGYIQITDRTKDVIKSGGEWISSIELENIAMAHPAVAMAACIARPDPKWDERPLLVVVKREGTALERDELLKFYEGKVAKWMIPDDVVFVAAIPLGATGKILKNRLRAEIVGSPRAAAAQP